MARKKRKGTIKENLTEGSYKNSNISVLFLVCLFIFNIGRSKRGRKIRNSICKLYFFPFLPLMLSPYFLFVYFCYDSINILLENFFFFKAEHNLVFYHRKKWRKLKYSGVSRESKFSISISGHFITVMQCG